MEFTLPLDRMTVDEKLRTMETIWQDLCRNEPKVPSPFWHRDVLEAREARVRDGREPIIDWEQAKRELRESTS